MLKNNIGKKSEDKPSFVTSDVSGLIEDGAEAERSSYDTDSKSEKDNGSDEDPDADKKRGDDDRLEESFC